jgi:hypothetical protein
MRGLLVLLFGLTVLPGCVSAEADLPEIEITQPNIQFQAYPVVGIETTVTVSFPVNAGRLGASTNSVNQQAIKELRMRDVLLVPSVGVDNLGFVRHLRVTAAAASDSGPGTLIIDYERPSVGTQTSLHATPATPVDLLPLWRPMSAADRTVNLTLSVTGLLPATAWAVEGHFILSAKLHN